MAKVRCKETRVDTFFGNFLYDQKVSRSHFLRKLNEVVDWDRFTKKLLGYYRGKGETGQQDTTNQSVALSEWAKQRGFEVLKPTRRKNQLGSPVTREC